MLAVITRSYPLVPLIIQLVLGIQAEAIEVGTVILSAVIYLNRKIF